MRRLLSLLAALLLALAPAFAQVETQGVRSVAKKRGDVILTPGDVGAAPCIGTCAQWTSFVPQLIIVAPTASAIDVQTAISDAPNGADYLELQSGTIRSGGPLAAMIQARYGLTNAQMGAIFTAAGATTSALQPYAPPTLVQLGAAALDLSNVVPATGRASLQLGTLATASGLAGLDASAATAIRLSTSAALALNDGASRGLPITPQMFGALCNSNGTTGNGNDDTAAVQSAVNLAIALGATMKIPSKATMCRTTAAIDINDSVRIEGDYCKPYTNLNALAPTPGPGSWLFFDHNGPGLFTNGHNPSGMVFRNFCTIRPQPALVASGSWVPMAADYDFSIAGDDSRFEHIMMLNPTNGIFLQGRSVIEDVRGHPYQIGIRADADEDILRISDVHFWPFDAINVPAANYTRANLEALQLARVDNPMISNFFAIGAKICIHFTSNSFGITSKAKFSNLDCDLFGSIGILADAANVTAQFDNVTLQGAGSWDSPPVSTSAVNAVQVAANNVHFTFDNLRSTNTGADAVVVNGLGSWALLRNYTAEKWGLSTTACAVSANNSATVNVDPAFYDATGTYGTCLYGGSGTVNSYTSTKVN